MTAARSEGRRLLVINYHYPPSGAAGGLRWAGLSKYLVRLGWEAHYVTGAVGAGGPTGVKDGVQIHVCPRRRGMNDLYNALARRLRRPRGTANGGPPHPGVNGNGASLLGRLRIELATALIFPDPTTRGWVLRAAASARSLVRRLQPDVVVSSGPPHSAHLVAWLATIGSSARWFIDLRDPWAGPIATAWYSDPMYRSQLFRVLTPRLERLAFRAAHGVIANTPELAAALAAKYPAVAVACMRNGVDPECLPPPATRPYPGLGIAYVGTLYGSRDLGPVMQALRAFLERRPDAVQAGSKLRIAGHAEALNARTRDEEIASLGLEQHVDVLGLLPREQALDVVSRSRLAVVLAEDWKVQVPAKLYELVAMGVPTLLVAGERGAAAAEAQRLGATVLDPSDIGGIVTLLERLWRNEIPQSSPRGAAITHGEMAVVLDQLLTGEFSSNRWPIDPAVGG